MEILTKTLNNWKPIRGTSVLVYNFRPLKISRRQLNLEIQTKKSRNKTFGVLFVTDIVTLLWENVYLLWSKVLAFLKTAVVYYAALLKYIGLNIYVGPTLRLAHVHTKTKSGIWSFERNKLWRVKFQCKIRSSYLVREQEIRPNDKY